MDFIKLYILTMSESYLKFFSPRIVLLVNVEKKKNTIPSNHILHTAQMFSLTKYNYLELGSSKEKYLWSSIDQMKKKLHVSQINTSYKLIIWIASQFDFVLAKLKFTQQGWFWLESKITENQWKNSWNHLSKWSFFFFYLFWFYSETFRIFFQGKIVEIS